MSTDQQVIQRMDPALKKLMDMLPQEDPDKRMVRVWAQHCRGVHVIAANEPTDIDFGVYEGPEKPALDAVIYAQYLHVRAQVELSDTKYPTLRPGDELHVTVTVTVSNN